MLSLRPVFYRSPYRNRRLPRMRIDLTDGAARFEYGHAVSHDSGQIRIGECDAPVRVLAQYVAGSGFTVFAEEEARLRAHVGVAPAVQNDAGDVAISVKPGFAKHSSELVADLLLIAAE